MCVCVYVCVYCCYKKQLSICIYRIFFQCLYNNDNNNSNNSNNNNSNNNNDNMDH